MAEFAELLLNLNLYSELGRSAGRDGVKPSEVNALRGLVAEVADQTGPLLARIPLIFHQYTEHDIRHSLNVIARMGDIIPEETMGKLNGVEIALLILSALLHDVGMVVSDSEKAEAIASLGFRKFREESHSDRSKAIDEALESGNTNRARVIEDALLAEYYRRLHPERVLAFLIEHFRGRLRYREWDFTDDLARLCESHAWGVEESNNSLRPEKAISKLDDNERFYGVRVNLQYLACCLRLSDIMDFDRSRTPLPVFQHIEFSEQKSWEEWNKHLQVKGWEITPTYVSFNILCSHPAFYVAVNEFLNWIDDELRQCRHITDNKPQHTAERYKLLLPQIVDRRKVRMQDPSYVAGAFRFQLEYENIIALLMDKSLYPDSSLFLRELLQNSLDACRRKVAEAKAKDSRTSFRPRIEVWDKSTDSKDPHVIFEDNGVGMSQRIVEQFFLRVGKSYYRSTEFDAERKHLQEAGVELVASSQFGIGILSCFMAGDRLRVETHQAGHTPLDITIDGPTKYFVIRRLPPVEGRSFGAGDQDRILVDTGTRVTVYLRPGFKVDVWEVLNTFGVNLDFPVALHETGRQKTRTVGKLRWEKSIATRDFQLSSEWRSALGASHLMWLETYARAVDGKHFMDLLVPSDIPFNRHEFSSYIHGRSWFWLFKKEGELTPRRGFLEIGINVEIRGLPQIVGKIEEAAHKRHLRPIDYIEDLVNEDFDRSQEDIVWSALSEEEQMQIRIAVERRTHMLRENSVLIKWYEDPQLIKLLAEAAPEWADFPCALDITHLSGYRRAESVALNSILLPAGIVRWSPATGQSNGVELMPIFGGLRVDIRGPRAPRPAAHRLFIAEKEGAVFRDHYLLAGILHGADLVENYATDQRWRRWFATLCQNSQYLGLDWGSALTLYGAYIEERCRLAFRIGTEVIYLTRLQATGRFGGPVPLVYSWQHEGSAETQGLLKDDPVNQLFLEEPYGSVTVDMTQLPFRAVISKKGAKVATARARAT